MTDLNRRWISHLLALVCAVFASTSAQAQQRELRVISDRTDQGTLRPILDAFEARSGAKVEGVFMDQGLVNRLESRPTEADVVITKDAELLDIAAQRGLLDPFKSAKISSTIPPEFMDPAGRFFVDAYRARVIFYSKARVKPSELSSYEDLAKPQVEGPHLPALGQPRLQPGAVRDVLCLVRRGQGPRGDLRHRRQPGPRTQGQ